MEELNGKCKKMTTEIVAGAFNKSVSIFSQDNLMPSMEFIDHWEKSRLPAGENNGGKNFMISIPPVSPSWQFQSTRGARRVTGSPPT